MNANLRILLMVVVRKHCFFSLVPRTQCFCDRFFYILSLNVIDISTLYLSGTSKDNGESGEIGNESDC